MPETLTKPHTFTRMQFFFPMQTALLKLFLPPTKLKKPCILIVNLLSSVFQHHVSVLLWLTGGSIPRPSHFCSAYWHAGKKQTKCIIYLFKTLFNLVEAPFTKLLNFDVCVVWGWSDGPINNQEYNSFEIYAVIIKISMTEYHQWINGHYRLTVYFNTAVYGENWVR